MGKWIRVKRNQVRLGKKENGGVGTERNGRRREAREKGKHSHSLALF